MTAGNDDPNPADGSGSMAELTEAWNDATPAERERFIAFLWGTEEDPEIRASLARLVYQPANSP